MAQSIAENPRGYQFHAATEEEIKRALLQEAKGSRLKNVGKAILRLLLLPVLFAIFMLKWICTFCVRISAWIFYLAGGLMAIPTIVYLAQGDGTNALIGFIIGVAIFLIPTVAAFLVAVMGSMQVCLHNFVWAKTR